MDGVEAALTLVDYGERGLDLPPNLSFEDWQAVGRALRHMEANVSWWLGDWWRFGERKYGEAASQAAPTRTRTDSLSRSDRGKVSL